MFIARQISGESTGNGEGRNRAAESSGAEKTGYHESSKDKIPKGVDRIKPQDEENSLTVERYFSEQTTS
jgi:hypothetical protein